MKCEYCSCLQIHTKMDTPLLLEMIQNDKSFCINLIDLGTFQFLFWIIFALYGMMTPCDVSFIIFGHMDWFPQNQSNWFLNIPISDISICGKQSEASWPKWTFLRIHTCRPNHKKTTADRNVLRMYCIDVPRVPEINVLCIFHTLYD